MVAIASVAVNGGVIHLAHMVAKPGTTAITIITVLLLALMGWFLWRVTTFERAISRGETIVLPQFSSQESKLAGGTSAPAGVVYDVVSPTASSVGPKDAKLVVVEFLDFQCPFSKDASDTVRAMQAKYGNEVRFEIRHFPLTEIHSDAMPAAEAAGCAEAQGKFWAMHDRIFAQKGVLARVDLDGAALASGLDMAQFKTCMDKRESYNAIQQDILAGTNAGVRGTPTFFFNGRRVEGVIPSDTFDQLIKSMLQ